MLSWSRLSKVCYSEIRALLDEREAVSSVIQLIKQNRLTVLRPFLNLSGGESERNILLETIKDYLTHYRVVPPKKTRTAQLGVPTEAVLLGRPLALLRIPPEHKDYLKTVGPKTRNMIRKAAKQGYEFKEFEWDNHLDEIFEINTSKRIRSAGPMHGWYCEPANPRHHSEKERQYWKYFGVFKDDRLWAYLNLVLCGNFGFFKHFIGHAEHLKYGIMDYLLNGTVQTYAGYRCVSWLNYDWVSLDSLKGGTIQAFKEHVGFKAYAVCLDLENDWELLAHTQKLRQIAFLFI